MCAHGYFPIVRVTEVYHDSLILAATDVKDAALSISSRTAVVNAGNQEGSMDQGVQQSNQSQELLFEYEQLRGEILQDEVIVLQILGISAILLTAILGVVFSQAVPQLAGKGYLLLVATIILLVAMTHIIDKWRTTYRIASYLRIFHESQLAHVRYETRYLMLRQLPTKEEGYRKTAGVQLLTYTFILLGTYAAGSWCIWQDPYLQIQHTLDPYLQIQLTIFRFGFISLAPFVIWEIYEVIKSHRAYLLGHAEAPPFDDLWAEVKSEELKQSNNHLTLTEANGTPIQNSGLSQKAII